jgi:hypothetical protein
MSDMFNRLEGSGQLLRISKTVEPTTYRCAVVSPGELAELRRIEDVVRLGHVRTIATWFASRNEAKAIANIRPKYLARSATSIFKATKFMVNHLPVALYSRRSRHTRRNRSP